MASWRRDGTARSDRRLSRSREQEPELLSRGAACRQTRSCSHTRVQTVASKPGGLSFLSRVQLRPPTGTEVGRWFFQRYELDVGRKTLQFPEGLEIRALEIADDKTLHLALAVDASIAKVLALAAPAFDVTLSEAAFGRLPERPRPGLEPVDAIATVLRILGIGGKAMVARAAAAARDRPTPGKLRAVIAQSLDALRPALIADLRKRIFRYRFPAGWSAAGGAERFALRATIAAHDDNKGKRLPTKPAVPKKPSPRTATSRRARPAPRR